VLREQSDIGTASSNQLAGNMRHSAVHRYRSRTNHWRREKHGQKCRVRCNFLATDIVLGSLARV